MSKQNSSISNSRIQFTKFLLKCVLMVGIAILAMLVILPEYADSYSASVLYKMKRLETTAGPKIVLIGNSNLVYGINSEMLEKEFGMPVVNMGFHGACGNAFHEEMAKANISPGDIYIICHTHYCDDVYQNPVIVWTAIENHVSLYKLIRIEDIPTMVSSFPAYFKNCLALYTERVNQSGKVETDIMETFNEYGDIRGERPNGNYKCTENIVPSKIDDASIDRINALNEYINQNGATLLIAGYPILKCERTAKASEFNEFQRKLRSKVDCPVISDFRDYMYDDDYFWDSTYHLSTEGAQMRTTQLIEDLHKWQSEQK